MLRLTLSLAALHAAVLEVSPDVEGRTDDQQGLDVPDRSAGQDAERLPARAVPDREVVGAAAPAFVNVPPA
jgi:hypothetical protein